GGGLIIVILVGLPLIGTVDYFYSPNGFQGILSAGALIFFAYIGFEEIVRLAEETKNPKKVIPKAMIIAIIVSTVLYTLAAISVVGLLPWDKLAASHAPMADAVSTVLGNNGFIVLSVIALFSTFNTVLLSLLSTSRVAFGMGRDRSFPKVLSRIHKKRRTPWAAIAAISLLAIIFSVAFNMEVIAGVTDFLIFVTFAVINVSVIALRYKMPKAKRVFRSPFNIGKFPILPFLGFVTSILLMINLYVESALYGLLILVAGLLAYVVLKPKIRKKGYARR
ncbi:MAG TPA: amino acid permease, partial [archaeon]|nr:amino acid permease [archaeon]